MNTEIFYNIKHKITQLVAKFKIKLSSKLHPQGRPLKIKEEDALTLAAYQHASTRLTKRSVYQDFKSALACSYKTLVVSINRMAAAAMKILFILMRLGRKCGHIVKYTDSTDIPVCLKKNADSHKTMKSFAGFGYSSKGWYYGLKMTITQDAKGNILALKFTSPNTNDRDIFRSINADINGIIVADSGYVSKQLEIDMNIENRRWILIKPYKSMKKLMTNWQNILYRGRFSIEFSFRSMKLFRGLISSLPRSANGYIANYLNAIFSFIIL
jgi:hypothetical protein